MDWKWKKIIHRSSLELRKLIQLIENQHFKKNPPKNAKYFICKRFLELMVGDAL